MASRVNLGAQVGPKPRRTLRLPLPPLTIFPLTLAPGVAWNSGVASVYTTAQPSWGDPEPWHLLTLSIPIAATIFAGGEVNPLPEILVQSEMLIGSSPVWIGDGLIKLSLRETDVFEGHSTWVYVGQISLAADQFNAPEFSISDDPTLLISAISPNLGSGGGSFRVSANGGIPPHWEVNVAGKKLYSAQVAAGGSAMFDFQSP